MSDEMAGLMTQFEPSFQNGLAHAYARRFTVDQLAELNGFFVTPTGKAYAAESMIIMTDPEVITKMQAMMPALMKEIPRLAGKLEQAASDLPEPRKPEDLNDADKARLADLLGVPVEEIGRQGD